MARLPGPTRSLRRRTLAFNGGYVQVAYTLTGENRAYDRRLGTLAREYYGKRRSVQRRLADPRRRGLPALRQWRLGNCRSLRLCQPQRRHRGRARSVGGIANGFTLGLNWYLNNNFNVMFDWVYDTRDDVPANSAQGWVSGIGTEIQFQF